MGSAAYRVKRFPELPHSTSVQYMRGHSDYRSHSHSHSFTTTDAPWNVTQWIDPLDPHPKITSVPVLVIIRK